jgi:hypothetical protein
MTSPWTLAESRLIAERVMEWQVTEHQGHLFFVTADQKPWWLPTRAIPHWPSDPAAAAMALTAIQMDGWRIEHSFWTAASHTFTLRLRHPITTDAAEGNAREWFEAAMRAVLAAVEGG